MRSFGAEVVLTEALEGMDGAIRKARELYEQEPSKYFYADQYNNPANPLAHYETTGPEIWVQTNGQVTHVVAGVGTSGDVAGHFSFHEGEKPWDSGC
jgi:cysteine synthase B